MSYGSARLIKKLGSNDNTAIDKKVSNETTFSDSMWRCDIVVAA